MKIGILCERLLLGFGVDLVVHCQATELARRGHEVTVYTQRTDRGYEDGGYRIRVLPFPLSVSARRTERELVRRWRRYLDNQDVDAWVSHTYPFHALLPRLRRPVVVVDHGTSPADGMPARLRWSFWWQRYVDRWAFFPFAARIVTVSHFIAGQCPPPLRGRVVTVLYHGVEHYVRRHPPAPERRNRLRRALGFDRDDFVLLYVGRLRHKDQPYKGVADLLTAYEEVRRKRPRVQLILAGYGSAKDRADLEARGTTAMPLVSERRLAELYDLCDVYVSASRWEGFNLPMMEAQSYGKAPVLLQRGAHAELVHDGDDGLLLSSVGELSDTLLELEGDRRRVLDLGRAAKENAARFTWEENGRRLDRILEGAAAPQRHRPDQVDIIALNYNGRELLSPLLESLRASDYEPKELVVVDNGSTDGSADFVADAYPEVRLVRSPQNLLFAAGNNLGVDRTDGDFLLFVNNDVRLRPDAIRRLVERIRTDTDIAAVAPKLYFSEASPILESVGTGVTAELAAFNRGIGQVDVGQYDRSEQVSGACFACVLVRRSVYEACVGPLDSRYGAYYEDVDWCYRANLLGFRIVTEPAAVGYHLHSGTARRRSADWKFHLIRRNWIWTILKNCEGARSRRLARERVGEAIGIVRRGNDAGQRRTARRILTDTVRALPRLLGQRRAVQRRRVCSDDGMLELSRGERAFFDGDRYRPVYTLDNLEHTYGRLAAVNRRARRRWEQIREVNISKDGGGPAWASQATAVLGELRAALGVEWGTFYREIVADQTWRRPPSD